MFKDRWYSIALILILAFASCKEKKQQQAAEPPSPSSEFDQIPAIQNLSKQIQDEPKNPQLFYQRSIAYVELGNPINALEDIQQAIKLDSTVGTFYELLGDIYFSKQEYTRAITALEKGHHEAPDDTKLTLQLAKYQFYVGENAKSIRLLDDVLRKNVYNAEAYFLKGMVFKEIGDTAKSISNFQTSVEQNPKYYKAYMQLGLLLSKKKNKLAVDYFNNALKIDSSSYEAKYGIAMFYQEAGDNPKALELYHKMILEYPQEKDAYYNTGYIHFQMDSIDRAQRDFDHTIAVAPDYADAYYMRGLCAEMKKDFKNAKYFYQQTLNLKSEHQLALNGLQRLENS